jgi:hypothetical protein
MTTTSKIGKKLSRHGWVKLVEYVVGDSKALARTTNPIPRDYIAI